MNSCFRSEMLCGPGAGVEANQHASNTPLESAHSLTGVCLMNDIITLQGSCLSHTRSSVTWCSGALPLASTPWQILPSRWSGSSSVTLTFTHCTRRIGWHGPHFVPWMLLVTLDFAMRFRWDGALPFWHVICTRRILFGDPTPVAELKRSICVI
jgi:hypothetical protein